MVALVQTSPQWEGLHGKLVVHISPALQTMEKELTESVSCLPTAASEPQCLVPVAHNSYVPVEVGQWLVRRSE